MFEPITLSVDVTSVKLLRRELSIIDNVAVTAVKFDNRELSNKLRVADTERN